MYKKIIKKFFYYRKIILIFFWIILAIHIIISDFPRIIELIYNQSLFSEIKNTILLLFLSFFGKIIFILIFICIYYNVRHFFEIKKINERLNLWTNLSYSVNQVGEEVFNDLPIGIVLIDNTEHKIQWINNYADVILNKPTLNTPLYKVNETLSNLLNSSENKTILYTEKATFDCFYNKEINVFYLFDTTEREYIKKLYKNKTPTLIFVSLDNLENSLKNLDISEQSQIKVEYLSALSDFFDIYDSYLKQLSDDKFLILLNYDKLMNIIVNKFDILETIRLISKKYKLKITLSIGAACYNLSYNSLSNYAQNALELAKKRGGDQAVVNIENQKIQYFGATNTNFLEYESKISARVNSEMIEEILHKHDNCFIMGHINLDLDSLGSMIAFYKIASNIIKNKQHYLIIDEEKNDFNFKLIYQDLITEEKKLAKQIITTKQALKMIDEKSLLVIVDTQNENIVSSPELLKLTSQIIILDHHRANEKVINSIFSYVDPYASSTVEILMEIISFLKYNIKFTSLETSVIYGGLIIDTNYFTYRTSPRTLEIASKLISLGAEISKIKFWLRTELNQILEMNKLISEMEIYMNKIAIIKKNDICDNRSFLAKVSENVLNIQNIDAAFTIARLKDGRIGISARSYDRINVQVIMEQMGGGGHINSAATQIESNDLEGAIDTLKNILYLEYKESLKNMKIILLEDIKNKGNKNEIIKINSGYGNFLIKEKKALLATDDNIKEIKQKIKSEEEKVKKHNLLMQQLKNDIDNKQIDIMTTIGPKGKIYGKITLKQIMDTFYDKHNIMIDKKKLFLESEINSLGKYKVNVFLTKEINAYFFVNVKSLEKK
ncbi:50S ribosomal protein L9 [Candidatus Phytoplasma luffae]|uniref:Large ribosomal subunit protein bL9 n=1 Tax=Loofah witches'-broom phytoplasma TaxID=35773 RepID=A0A975IM96_LOWBP|nr:50S ribosomal protein L9 [Candidatus Phytoplasma luffae]QTX02884.1 50S ribosomal protein L9 [Candidatus Phytoplasma luffae]QTX03017.1 50S ribosomal protein L9 [Candidatus Phytoplasma luffae]